MVSMYSTHIDLYTIKNLSDSDPAAPLPDCYSSACSAAAPLFESVAIDIWFAFLGIPFGALSVESLYCTSPLTHMSIR